MFSLLSGHFPGFLHPGASLFALGNHLWSVSTVYLVNVQGSLQGFVSVVLPFSQLLAVILFAKYILASLLSYRKLSFAIY